MQKAEGRTKGLSPLRARMPLPAFRQSADRMPAQVLAKLGPGRPNRTSTPSVIIRTREAACPHLMLRRFTVRWHHRLPMAAALLANCPSPNPQAARLLPAYLPRRTHHYPPPFPRCSPAPDPPPSPTRRSSGTPDNRSRRPYARRRPKSASIPKVHLEPLEDVQSCGACCGRGGPTPVPECGRPRPQQFPTARPFALQSRSPPTSALTTPSNKRPRLRIPMRLL